MHPSIQDIVDHPQTLNFCFPLKDLESARVKLTPFIPSQHAQRFFDASKPHQTLYHYLPFGPFPTLDSFLQWYEARIRSDPTHILFAVLDKTRASDDDSQCLESPAAFAGIIGLLNTSPQHASTEIGFAVTIPDFQGTHVTRNAIGLLLQYCLNLPADGGLGLRRVQWQANSENLRSIRVAEKMGFVQEGIIRWQRVLPIDKKGKQSRPGDPVHGPGRDTALLAICWEDWETVRFEVDALIHQVIL